MHGPFRKILPPPVSTPLFLADRTNGRAYYRAMLRRARYCYGKLSVRLSVCLSVRNVEVL